MSRLYDRFRAFGANPLVTGGFPDARLVDWVRRVGECAPEGTYFGSHPADPAAFGHYPLSLLDAR